MNNAVPYRHYIFIADAHLRDSRDTGEFFRMLDRIDALPGDTAVVFLGDIFDVWFALPGYEVEDHRKFLSWCENARRKRAVFFVEGNHEFYLPWRHRKQFTNVQPRSIATHSLMFVHGDLINRKDYSYLFLRIFLRNPFMVCVFLLGAPFSGLTAVRHLNEKLHKCNQKHKHHVPEEMLRRFLARQERRGHKRIFAGHFHKCAQVVSETGARLEMIPAWKDAHEISVYHTEQDSVETSPWTSLPLLGNA